MRQTLTEIPENTDESKINKNQYCQLLQLKENLTYNSFSGTKLDKTHGYVP
jgi:hypothetical protein